MNADRALGEFEQMVLLAALRLGDEAYGVTILAEIAARTGRTASPGAMYTTLHRMEDKGLIRFRDGAPTPERGGRAKRFVEVTKEGRGGAGQRAGGVSEPDGRVESAAGEATAFDGRELCIRVGLQSGC